MVHLSHIDLDGYGCQFVTNTVLKEKIKYVNVDYPDITEALELIVLDIQENETLLITDLNLNPVQAEFIDTQSKIKNFKIILLDHHYTGLEQSKKYDWYHLGEKCGTMLTFEYFKGPKKIEAICEMIDIYDRWLKQDEYLFQRGTYLAAIVFNYKIDSIKNVYFKIEIIRKIGYKLANTGIATEYIESLVPEYLKKILIKLCDNSSVLGYLRNPNMGLPYKMAVFPAGEFEPFLILNSICPVLFYKDISSSTFQYCSEVLLRTDESLKDSVLAKIDTKKGTMSFRSINGKASTIAKLFNGGGHNDAAGAFVNIDKDIKEVLTSYINT